VADRDTSHDLRIRQTSGWRGRRLILSGELDVLTSPRLRAALDQIPSGTKLTIDTTRLTFIDSTGLGCLLEVSERIGSAYLTLRPGDATERVLQITGLLDRFRIERR
jgi:anti-sigma B factor antagonist